MGVYNDAAALKAAIEKICEIKIEEMTRQCMRVYNATVTSAPDIQTGTCTVRFVGENTDITISYLSSLYGHISVDDTVLVAVLSNNFKNAFVWIKLPIN